MVERLVDVMNDKNNVLHVFSVTAESRNGKIKDSDFEQKALKAAVAAEIVPKTEAKKLRARAHVSRGGQLAPVGDALQIKHEQNERLHQRISERAYFLWEAAGYPDGRAEDFWNHACALESVSTS